MLLLLVMVDPRIVVVVAIAAMTLVAAGALEIVGPQGCFMERKKMKKGLGLMLINLCVVFC